MNFIVIVTYRWMKMLYFDCICPLFCSSVLFSYPNRPSSVSNKHLWVLFCFYVCPFLCLTYCS